MAKNGGAIFSNPRNETTGGSGPEDFDVSGAGLYGSLDEVMSMHLSQDGASLVGSPNIEEGRGIMGGPAEGEDNPAGFSATGQGWGGGKK